MRALVTGAGGFVGRHVVARLVDAGADVIAFDRRFGPDQATAALGCGSEMVMGDVLDAASVRRAMDGCDAVFHLAAVYSYARADAAWMQTVNVGGTRTVLEAAARGGRRRVVHTSTCATCGPVPGRAAHEGDVPPAGELTIPYKRTKVDGESLALAAARAGVDVVVVNPTVPVGPGDLRPTPTGQMVADVFDERGEGGCGAVRLQRIGIGPLLDEDEGVARFVQGVQLTTGLVVHVFDRVGEDLADGVDGFGLDGHGGDNDDGHAGLLGGFVGR